jgi:peptidoglycan/xylan/chitin deacetylase (PgdA/CDA1 family)/outer membrane lipoprotein-sorting protein
VQRGIVAAVICVLGVGAPGMTPMSHGAVAWAQPAAPGGPMQWLESAATAPRRVSYEGTKIVTVWAGGVHASQVHVYHQAPDRTRLEYPAAGRQPARTVVITGRTEVVFIPSRNLFIRRPASGAGEGGPIRRALLVQNYVVRFDGAEAVAGRPARIIDVQGKLPGRPRVRVWVVAQTHLILRFERYGPGGALQEASAFLSITINPALSADLFNLTPPPGALVRTQPPVARLTIEQIARRVGFIPQLPAYLPPGYQLVGSRVSVIRGTPTATFAFSDGVSTLTLFESRGPRGAPPNGRQIRIGSAQGTVIPRGVATLLHWNIGAVSFTLVGELPQDELIRIGASVPPTNARRAQPGPVAHGASALIAALLTRASRLPVAEAALPDRFVSGALGRAPLYRAGVRGHARMIGRSIHSEEVRLRQALAARGLAPVIVKVAVASDGVTHLPDGRIGRLAWIQFTYGSDAGGGPSAVLHQVQERATVLSAAVFQADSRVFEVMLSGYDHGRSPFQTGREDATFTARVLRSRFMRVPAALAPGAALARAGDVWYSPALLSGGPRQPPASWYGPRASGGFAIGARIGATRSAESAERFHGSLPERVMELKDRLAGLLFGVESRGRLWRGNPRTREIALTFDDGPSPLVTPLLLAVLRRYGAPATFFVIGEHARAYSYLVAEMAADGDEVGDHTFHHPNLTGLPPAAVAREIDTTAALIREITGRPPRWFRPPGGDYTTGVADAARRAGMGLAMWTENSGDWTLPPAKALGEQVPGRAEPGSIILLHSTTMNTARALPEIIVKLRREGYVFVTLSRLAADAE